MNTTTRGIKPGTFIDVIERFHCSLTQEGDVGILEDIVENHAYALNFAIPSEVFSDRLCTVFDQRLPGVIQHMLYHHEEIWTPTVRLAIFRILDKLTGSKRVEEHEKEYGDEGFWINTFDFGDT